MECKKVFMSLVHPGEKHCCKNEKQKKKDYILKKSLVANNNNYYNNNIFIKVSKLIIILYRVINISTLSCIFRRYKNLLLSQFQSNSIEPCHYFLKRHATYDKTQFVDPVPCTKLFPTFSQQMAI